MKNILRLIIATVGIALIFNACQKEGDLPFYKSGIATELTSSATAVSAAVADSSKTALTLNWTWPNYATDSTNQKFIVQIAPEGKSFASPVTRELKGVKSATFTAKELNKIVFGFGDISAAYPLEIRIVSSYANNNDLYQSNTVKVAVTPYIIPVALKLTPAGPLTLLVENASNNAVTFNWNATAFGNLPLNYAIQIDKAGGTFTAPLVLTFGTALTGGITVNALNNAAINAGIAPKTTGDLSIRVVAYQGTNFANPVYSNAATLKVTTYLATMTWYIPGDYVAASYPGSTFADWAPDKSPKVQSLASAPTNLEGYVYMANANNQWKFASKPNWDGPNYGDGGGGVLDASAGNINSPAGYYKLNADAAKMKFTAVATAWGVIGSASPKGWDDETALTYNPTAQTWQGVLHLTAAEIKFRANHNWDFNYGSSAKNATLNSGGDNIPVAVESDYSITLDLSHPNAYTYSANRWGLIGDATPGGWDTDTNMTWDATNKVFTVTLDLIAKAFKFRANDAWDVNYGGNLSALTSGGDNIAVAIAGNYTITFDPWALKATVTKN